MSTITVSVRRAARAAAGLVALWTCLSAGGAHAAWTPDGTVICNAAGTQWALDMTPDGLGGFYIAWSDARAGVGRIYLQHVQFDGSIAAGWPTNGLPVTTSTLDQANPKVIADGMGGAIVAWSQFYAAGDWDIHVQRITSGGAIYPGWPAAGAIACFAGGVQNEPVLASDRAQGAFVAWRDWRGSSSDVYAQHVGGSGGIVAGWLGNGNPVCTATGDQSEVAMVGGFSNAFVVWTDRRGANADIYGQNVNADGSVSWATNGALLCGAAGDQFRLRVASDENYGMYAVWIDPRSGGANWDIYGLRANAGGVVPGWAANGTAIVTHPATQSNADVVPDGTGGMIAVWADGRNPGNGIDVYAQRLQGDGIIAWVADGIQLCANSASQSLLEVAPDGGGGAIVAWEDERNGGQFSTDIYGQHVTGAGQLAWPLNGQRICGLGASQDFPRVVWDGTFGNRGAFVAWEDSRAGQPDIYAIRMTGFGNLNATAMPIGFSSPIVPRNASGATLGNATLTPTLDGNANTTWLNWGVFQEGPNNMPTWPSDIILDEEHWLFTGPIGDDNIPGSWQWVNAGPQVIRGGRHSLTLYADFDGAVPESNEFDNVWGGQWVWSPLPLVAATPVVRPYPPHPSYGWLPNSDGLMFEHDPGFAWVTGMAPLALNSDFDLYVYDDYSGSLSGFSNEIARSQFWNAQTEFVVGHFQGTPNPVYPAVVRYSFNSADCAADQNTSNGRIHSGANGSWLGQTLAVHRLVDVYEGFLNAGNTYYFGLDRTSGASDLAFEVFPPTPGAVHGHGGPGSAASGPLSADEDVLAFTATMDGWHPIVVYRAWGYDAASEVTYNFFWRPTPFVSVEQESDAPLELAFGGASPNPVRGRAEMTFALPGASHVRLDLYDIGGRRVRTLADREFAGGHHAVAWSPGDGPALSAGVYWARMEAAGRALTKRVVVMR